MDFNAALEDMEDAADAYNLMRENGITLRDWFAGQALAGMLANCDDTGMSGWAHDPKYTAVKSYELADAMLEARK